MSVAHSASMPDTTSKLRRCRICGFTGPTISPGLYARKDGKYQMVDRCVDHGACASRREERARNRVPA